MGHMTPPMISVVTSPDTPFWCPHVALLTTLALSTTGDGTAISWLPQDRTT